MPHFALTYKLSAEYFARRDPFKDGHMSCIAQATASGGMVLAGVLGIPPTSAMYVFDRDGAAEEFARTDPYVTGGVITDWSVASWIPVVGPGAA